ncbi:Hypothetical predicted protein, partial [Marmota monax]
KAASGAPTLAFPPRPKAVGDREGSTPIGGIPSGRPEGPGKKGCVHLCPSGTWQAVLEPGSGLGLLAENSLGLASPEFSRLQDWTLGWLLLACPVGPLLVTGGSGVLPSSPGPVLASGKKVRI